MRVFPQKWCCLEYVCLLDIFEAVIFCIFQASFNGVSQCVTSSDRLVL